MVIEFASEEILEGLKRDQEKQEMVLEKPEIETEELQTNQPSRFPKNKALKLLLRMSQNMEEMIVKITNGQETKELKYKKALSLIESGEGK